MIGERIKQARKAAGLTQQQAADAIGVSRSTFAFYETGKRRPDAPTIKKIANALSVTGDFILDIEVEKEKPTPEGRLPADYYDLSDSNKAIVNSLIEQLLASQSGD